ncbi:SWF/SNF helicase family protein, partial [bacterium]|nr:SWF/SNF helicase family protein [bacterium]
SPQEAKLLHDLSRAGKRLMGFCRTNLFKRLESSGHAFLESIRRHILRNEIYLFAIQHSLPLPIGTQDSVLLDSRFSDEDLDSSAQLQFEDIGENNNNNNDSLSSVESKAAAIKDVYEQYRTHQKNRFNWLRPDLFVKTLEKDLIQDCEILASILKSSGEWKPARDTKLKALYQLLNRHENDKVLIFTQFADTVRYLESQLTGMGIQGLAGVTGDSADPTSIAWRFSPRSNAKQSIIEKAEELQRLIATDILSEGQNLQDCSIIVNYDLPWALIRLIQRAGRIDRIGQTAEKIICHSFLPADGVERIIRLRERVRRRLVENAEVVGSDEAFFEDDKDRHSILNLYNEKAGILDGDSDTEVDLASYAYQIWKNAITADPTLQK